MLYFLFIPWFILKWSTSIGQGFNRLELIRPCNNLPIDGEEVDSADDLHEIVNEWRENYDGDDHVQVFNFRHENIENFREAPGYPIEWANQNEEDKCANFELSLVEIVIDAFISPCFDSFANIIKLVVDPFLLFNVQHLKSTLVSAPPSSINALVFMSYKLWLLFAHWKEHCEAAENPESIERHGQVAPEEDGDGHVNHQHQTKYEHSSFELHIKVGFLFFVSVLNVQDDQDHVWPLAVMRHEK